MPDGCQDGQNLSNLQKKSTLLNTLSEALQTELNAFICHYTYTNVQYNKILSSHIPTYLEVTVSVQGQPPHATPGTDRVKGHVQEPNSGCWVLEQSHQ